MQARFELARRLNLRGVIAGSLIIDYHKVADQMTAERYVGEVIAGVRFDTNLSKQIKKGFVPRNLIPNYTYDSRSLNYGVAIGWENPDYAEPRTAKVIPFEPRHVMQTHSAIRA